MKLEVALEKRLGDFRFSAGFAVEGQRLGVYGKSGSGKSTLMGMLAGLIRPDAGLIRLDGETLYDGGRKLMVPPERRRLAVVFQHAHLFPHLNVRRNLLYGYKRIPRRDRRISPEALGEVLGLGPLLERDVTTLSGGERRRVALGRAVLSCPRLILMDEPLTGLDAGSKYQIIPYLKAVFDEFGIPLIFISHSLNEMRLMTDDVLLFDGGRLLSQSSAEELARSLMGSRQAGYINLLTLERPRPVDDLWAYDWGGQRLILTERASRESALFQLSSKDVTLFKGRPEASSARNLLPCRVGRIFESGNRIGVELDCGGRPLVSQLVREAVRELEIKEGSEIYAIVKASAFRPLY
ncbi:molybdenum ABC transporter ATP-binding protein [Desulfuromonas sp. KJ2020]|uniref:molybdenum ABC transporter ATP-binding protein n=1 Tax=Desulfuromonas sp. KJ2020 TaxID=2919173 RepID=UPI0020A79775|nr:molybdenum ABC transporter ATP-binding protein [Desulfuromonas sp. KJ2020]MCP3175857.1 molybdenum ABC transporter ATP-binding protein [Desulfuromonas sp. KJ2020]